MQDEEHIIIVPNQSSFPGVYTLAALAAQHRRVIVEMPYEDRYVGGKMEDPALDTKRRLTEQLTPILPDHAVTQSGMIDSPTWKDPGFRKDGVLHRCRSRLIIRQLTTAAEIEAALPRLVDATRDFRHIANDLMTRQAAELGIDPAFFAEPHGWAGHFEQTGQLDADWQRFFHGYECGFNSTKHHLNVEVRLGFQQEDGSMEFGVLDPGFFCRFVRSNKNYKELDELLRDDGANALRAFERLAERGYLKWLENATWHCAGWVALD